MNSDKHESNHHRRSIRLAGYDYSHPGAYFITICTHYRECLFGEIVNGVMCLNKYGQIVLEEWNKSASIRTEIELGDYVVMPNHFHAIVVISWMGDPPVTFTPTDQQNVGAYGHTPLRKGNPTTLRSPSKTIGALVRGFKSAVTKRINILRETPRNPVWQRNYWEHIIRDENSFQQIADYILTNPQNWEKDQLFSKDFHDPLQLRNLMK